MLHNQITFFNYFYYLILKNILKLKTALKKSSLLAKCIFYYYIFFIEKIFIISN